MSRITAEATTREFLSQPSTNPLDSLMQDALRLYFFSPMKMRDSVNVSVKMRRKPLLHEAAEDAVARSIFDPKHLYLAVTSSTMFTPGEVLMWEYVSDKASWPEHFSAASAKIVELELPKRFPALKRLERARYTRFDPFKLKD